MTATEKYLTPCGLFQDQSFEQYCSKLPEIYFKKEVPQDVLKNFEVIEQLLAHSYYEHRFIDEAHNKALDTFEMAMNIRYNELKRTSKDLTFPQLIQCLVKKNQFDSDVEILKYFMGMRNHHSHPKRHSVVGILVWNQITSIISVINQMYEDTTLRLKRRELEKEILLKLQNINCQKTLLIDSNNEKYIAYEMKLLFVDNKEIPNQYHFSYTPIFNLDSLGEGHTYVPESFELILINPVLEEDTLVWQTPKSKETVCFYVIEKDRVSNEIYTNWFQAFQNTKHAFSYERSIHRNNNNLYCESFWQFLKK